MLAQPLMRLDGDEATLRTVISRAYYSVFLAMRIKFAREGASHKQFWTFIAQSDPYSAEWGQRFRQIRNAADYGDAIPDLKDEATRWLKRAERLTLDLL